MAKTELPTYETLMNPAIEALKDLGGSATIEELFNKVVEIAGITDEQLEVIHDPDRGSQTEVEYRLTWTRTYLKKYGILENSGRGVWALTQKGRQTEKVNPKEISRYFREQRKPGMAAEEADEEPDAEQTWRDKLLATLQKMDPSAFERLVQRMLRETGFIQVQVTGRTGDGGIDGKGICAWAGC